MCHNKRGYIVVFRKLLPPLGGKIWRNNTASQSCVSCEKETLLYVL